MKETTTFERYVAAVAAVGCIVFTVAIWVSVSRIQPMWPLPALYLIEAAVLSTLAAIAFTRPGTAGRAVAWAAIGMLLAFAILGMFSVGALYLPTILLLVAVCLTADLRNRSNLLLHLGLFLLAGLAQASLMLAISGML